MGLFLGGEDIKSQNRVTTVAGSRVAHEGVVAWWECPSCRCGCSPSEETQEAPQAPFSTGLMKHEQVSTLGLEQKKPTMRKATAHGDSGGNHTAFRVPCRYKWCLWSPLQSLGHLPTSSHGSPTPQPDAPTCGVC